MGNYEKIQWARERIEHWWTVANERHGTNIDPCPTVEFSNRMTTTAGTAYSKRNHIKLSTTILFGETTEKFDQTIGHEIAHVFANRHYGQRCNHGSLWVATMRRLGLPPRRCHQYESAQHNGRASTLSFPCFGCNSPIRLGAIRRRRLQAGTANYHCGVCRTSCVVSLRAYQNRAEPLAVA